MSPLPLSTSEPSICIPRVFSNIDKTCVKDVFEELFGEGCIERIDMIQRRTGNSERFQRVFVHFKYWSATLRSQQVRQRLIDGHQLKIVYNGPWFWKCSASRIPKPKDKASHPYTCGKCETYKLTGEKTGEKMGNTTKGEEWDASRESQRDASRDTKKESEWDASRGDDKKDTETCWRQVDRKTRGKKNKYRNSRANGLH